MTSTADRRLRLAATAFAVAVVLHGIDHARRGAHSVRGDVFWVGTSAILLEVGVVALVFARHRLAPLAAASVGSALAAGYVLVHFTPRRSFFNDSLVSGGAELPSIVAATLEVAAALALAATGWLALRARGGLASAADAAAPAADPAGYRSPVVVGMALANVAILAVSLASLAS